MYRVGELPVIVDRPQVLERSMLRAERWGVRLAVVAGAIGVSVLLGYQTRTTWIVKLSSGLPPMYPNAALGLLCGSVAVVGSRRSGPWRVAAAIGAIGVGAIGTAGLALNVAGAGRTWFEGLFPAHFVSPSTLVPGRPAPEACLAFVLLAAALTSLILRRAPMLGQGFALAGTAVGLSAIVGYLLGVDRSSPGGHPFYVGMALHTAIGIVLIGAAAVCVRPNVGVTAQILNGGIVGGISRRATLIVAVSPALLLVAGVTLSHVLPTEALSQSVFSVMQVAVLSGAVLIPSAVISRTERQLRHELEAARRMDEQRGNVNTLVEAVTAEMTIVSPKLPGWEMALRYEPATGHLAGDSVQVHVRQLPRPATLIVIVDVAGHDVFSAVVAYGLQAHIAALWEAGVDLGAVAASANAKLLRRNTIATAVLVVFEPGAESLEVVNAGHPAPVHVRSGQQTYWTPTGPLFGLPKATYDVRVCDIKPGDLAVFYTDGVIEARSPDGRQLGEEFLHRLISARRTESAAAIADSCVNAAVEHAESRLRDDVLVIAARRQMERDHPER